MDFREAIAAKSKGGEFVSPQNVVLSREAQPVSAVQSVAGMAHSDHGRLS